MKNKKRLLIIAVLAFAAVVVLVMIFGKTLTGGEKAVSVDTEKVVKGEIEKIITASGVVRSSDFEEIIVPLNSKVIKSYGNVNKTVRKGDLLANLDSGDLEFLLKKTEINDAQLKADLKDLKNNTVTDSYLIATKERQIKMNALDTDSLKKKIMSYEIRAGIDGLISNYALKNGQIPSAGSIIRIVGIDRMTFELKLPQESAALVDEGQTAKISINGFDDILDAIVTEVKKVAEIDVASGGKTPKVGITLKLNGKTENLAIGYEGEATINVGKETGVLVTKRENVKTNKNGEPYVFVVENGKAKERLIKTGIFNGVDIVITEGVSEGETIIANPVDTLKDGESVLSKNK